MTISGASKITLQGLVDFRKQLNGHMNAVSEQETKTKSAMDVVSDSWKDGNFKDFEEKFSQDVERIKALVEELDYFNNVILKNFEEKVRDYLGINY